MYRMSIAGLLVAAAILNTNGTDLSTTTLVEIGRISLFRDLPGATCPVELPFDFASNEATLAVNVLVNAEPAINAADRQGLRWTTVLLNLNSSILARANGQPYGVVSFKFSESSFSKKYVLTNEDSDIVAYRPDALNPAYRLRAQMLSRDPEFSLGLVAASLSSGGDYLASVYWEHPQKSSDLGLHHRSRLESPRLLVFDVNDGRRISECTPPVKYGDSVRVAVSSDGSLVAYLRQAGAKGLDRPNVLVVRSSDCQLVQSWSLPNPPSSIQFLPDSKNIMVTLTWGPLKGQELSVLDGATVLQVGSSEKWGAARPMAISHDGRWLALASGSHKFTLSEKWQIAHPGIEIWDLKERRVTSRLTITKLTNSQFWIPVPRFSPDDRVLAVSGPNCTVHLYQWSP